MATFEVQGPDGSTFEIEAPDLNAAVAGFKRFQSGKFSAPTQTADDGSSPLVFDVNPKPSVAESLARGAKQGATLNLGDELTGLAKASPVPGADIVNKNFPGPIDAALGAGRLIAEKLGLGSGGQAAYDQAVGEERAANAAAERANPVSYFGGGLLGGLATVPVLPMAAPFKAAAAAGALKQGAAAAGNLALNGAIYGGIAGAGGAEGGLAERAAAAPGGALVGALLTPVVGGLAAGAGKVGGFLADHVRASNNPQMVADRLVSRAATRDSADIPTFADAIAQDHAQAPGLVQNLTAADLGGTNLRGLAGHVARQPGTGRDAAVRFLNERQTGSPVDSPLGLSSQADRVGEQLSARAPYGGTLATEEAILARRSAEGRKLYKPTETAQIDYESPAGKVLLDLYKHIPARAKSAAQDILDMDFTGAAPKANPGQAAYGQTGSGGKKPPSLSHFIARNGGLELNGETADLPQTIKGVGRLVHENGKSIDGFWRDRLIEEGYLPPDADGGQARDITNELYNLLERDLSGEPVYPEGWEAKGRARMTREDSDHLASLRDEVLRDLARRGQISGIDDAAVTNAAKHLAARTAPTGADAYDMALAEKSIPAQPQKLTARHWDLIKQGLDKIVTDHTDLRGRLDAVGYAADKLRKAVASATEEAVPGLKEARKVWRGHTEERAALLEGEKAWGKTLEEVQRDVAGLSETGRDLYRQGALNALKERIGGKGDGHNAVTRVSGTPNLREKLKALIPDRDSYNSLMTYLTNEEKAFATRRKATGGSETAERLAEELDANAPEQMLAALEDLRKLGSGNVFGALRVALRYISKVNPSLRESVMEEVRKVILNPDPQAIEAFQARLAAKASLPAPIRERITKLTVQALPRTITSQLVEQRTPQHRRPTPAQAGRSRN